MTNAEKYKEVFGLDPSYGICPTQFCNYCPCVLKDDDGCIACDTTRIDEWWQEEYKEIKHDND